MSKREVGPIAKELIEAKKRIENPENWCQGAYIAGGKMCAREAIYINHLSDLKNAMPALKILDGSANELFGCWSMAVNDYLGHAKVMQMYDHAIQRALSEGK